MAELGLPSGTPWYAGVADPSNLFKHATARVAPAGGRRLCEPADRPDAARITDYRA